MLKFLLVLVLVATASGSIHRSLKKYGKDIVCDGKVDIVYIMDTSGSIDDNEWESVRLFFNAITASLTVGPDDAHVAQVTFSTTATVLANLAKCDNAKCVTDITDDIQVSATRSTTNIADGLRKAIDEVIGQAGDRPNIDNICLFFSDGAANVETGNTNAQADRLKQGCRVISIGIDGADQTLLQRISSGDDIFNVDGSDFTDLLALVEPIIQSTCKDPLPKCKCINLPYPGGYYYGYGATK